MVFPRCYISYCQSYYTVKDPVSVSLGRDFAWQRTVSLLPLATNGMMYLTIGLFSMGAGFHLAGVQLGRRDFKSIGQEIWVPTLAAYTAHLVGGFARGLFAEYKAMNLGHRIGELFKNEKEKFQKIQLPVQDPRYWDYTIKVM
jgi:hypothetical protein